MIHLWASQGSWKSVQMLVRNLVKEGLEPNYQTYAGLLEVCGNINDVRKAENVLTEMEQKVCAFFEELEELSKLIREWTLIWSLMYLALFLFTLSKLHSNFWDNQFKKLVRYILRLNIRNQNENNTEAHFWSWKIRYYFHDSHSYKILILKTYQK